MEFTPLIIKAQQGDQAAYTQVCLQFAPLVRRQSQQSHLAAIREDAAAEAWLAVAQAVQDYDPLRGVPFAGFVAQRVHYQLWNLFKQQRRRWQREVSEPPALSAKDQAAPDPAAIVVMKEAGQDLQHALSSLAPQQRQILLATIVTQRKLRELAAVYQVSPQAISQQQRRALKRLKTVLTGMYESEGR